MNNNKHRFRVGDIQPNPFRNIDHYPLQPKKIEGLRESIRATSFWDNIVARINGDGKPEIAYGHHRLQALREELGEDAEVQLIIRDLDGTMMLKMMVRENMEEWGTSAIIEQESVRAVVLAYGAGKVELPAVDRNTAEDRRRYAPSFVLGGSNGDPNAHLDRPYTSTTVASFLGWNAEKVRVTLQALELIELGIVTPAYYRELGSAQARAVTEYAQRAASGALAWADAVPEQRTHFLEVARPMGLRTAEAVASALREGKVGLRTVRAAVPEKRVPRGLVRHARRTIERSPLEKARERYHKKQEKEKAALRAAADRFSEDCYWFVEGVKEIYGFMSLSWDARRTILNLLSPVKNVLERLEEAPEPKKRKRWRLR